MHMIKTRRETTGASPALRWSIRFLCLLMACAACYFAGHRAGFSRGYSEASAEYGLFISGTRAYDVSDLVLPLKGDLND